VINSTIFTIFYILIYLVGRGFFIIISKIFDFKINQKSMSKASHLFPLIGLFTIGEFKLIVNFFSGSNNFLYFVILFGLVLNLIIKINKDENLLHHLLISFILGMSSNTIQFSYDAGLYHLNSQFWINESKLTIGIVNLHSRYGYSSFIEYINAPTWIFDNFIFQHFTNLVFIVSFLSFIYKCLFSKHFEIFKISGISIVTFAILDNFGISGGRNGFLDIESVSKQDTPFAVTFMFLLIYISYFLLNKNIQNEKYLFLISFLFIFSFQLRIFALCLAPLIAFIMIKNIKLIRNLLLTVSLSISFLWIIKNVLVSSCIFYPIDFTCIKTTKWYHIDNARLETLDLRDFHLAWDIPNTNIFEWLNMWTSKDINLTVLINFSFSILIIFVLQILTTNRSAVNNFNLLIIPVYLLFIWSVSSPSIRMGLSIFIYTVFLTGVYRNEIIRILDQKIILYLSFVVSILLMPRIDNYKVITSGPLNFANLQPIIVDYIKFDSPYWGVKSSLGSQCWVNLECVPEKVQISESLIYSFRSFQKINS